MTDNEHLKTSHRHPFRNAWIFFLLVIPYMECVLRLCMPSGFFGMGLLRAAAAGAACGMLLLLIVLILPGKHTGYIFSLVILALLGICFIAEAMCQSFFGTFYTLGYMLSMTGSVAGEFMGTALSVILKHIYMIPLELAPVLLLLIFRSRIFPQHTVKNYPKRRKAALRLSLESMVVMGLVMMITFTTGSGREYYTYEFSAGGTIPRYGLLTTLRLEAQYALTGIPMKPVTDYTAAAEVTVTEGADGSEETGMTAETEETEEAAPVYAANVLDIDFDTLIDGDTDSTLLNMDQYFASQQPTMQNEYTGLFEGKNLIFITAEAFSTPVISEELTPALYRLANEGFVFNNYYQPNWTQSTQGGEYANMTGLIPVWIGNSTSFLESEDDQMSFAMGYAFTEEGYTVTAYHDGYYSYYDRNLTHPNLGYDYYGIGNGLSIDSANLWPESDLEMIQATIDDPIRGYVEEGQPFHLYYMSISGHCNYGFNYNQMSAKNQDAVAELEGSETVRAYIACQLELEYALEYLLDALEEAGIAEDTVIVLGADHYPYAMAETSTDYYNELAGTDDTDRMTSRYKNTLILWSGSMEEPVEIDTPCSSIDILPTIYNLFGIDYDSRLFSGRDILAPDAEPGQVSTDMKIVTFPDTGSGRSFVTAAGIYEASTGIFTPFDETLELPEDYVDQVTSIANDRWSYAKYVITEDYYSHIFPDWTAPEKIHYEPPAEEETETAEEGSESGEAAVSASDDAEEAEAL